jgi:hypothetical protein
VDLGNILNAFGASNKETVYMSITPSVGLELISVDIHSRTVKSYMAEPLDYNETTRDIANYEQFKMAVSQLFNRANINPKCNVILNVPTVLFGYKDISIIVGSDAVSTVITSEVEQSYIFRRSDPTISWSEFSDSSTQETRRVFYTAIQSEVVENLKNAFAQLGANLLEIEISLTSKLKTLDFAGFTTEQMNSSEPWNLLVVNDLGYSICSMKGRNLIEYYEEAIPLKSFEGEEVYKAISASAQLTIMSYPAGYLYIVSDTDAVSAEILANKLPIDGTLQFIENNKFKKHEFLETSLDVLQDDVLLISLDAIGVTLGKTVTTNINFNLLNQKGIDDSADPNEPFKVMIGDKEYTVTLQIANMLALALAVTLIVIMLVLLLISNNMTKNLNNKLQNIQTEVQSVQNELSQLEMESSSKGPVFDPKIEMKNVLDANKKKLISYIAMGEAIPRNLWVTYFVTAGDGGVNIKGKAASVEDIYIFFTNLKNSILDSGLKLTRLEMESKDLDDLVSETITDTGYYEFEITNMSVLPDSEDGANENSEDSENSNEDNTNKKPRNNLSRNIPNTDSGADMEPIPSGDLE